MTQPSARGGEAEGPVGQGSTGSQRLANSPEARDLAKATVGVLGPLGELLASASTSLGRTATRATFALGIAAGGAGVLLLVIGQGQWSTGAGYAFVFLGAFQTGGKVGQILDRLVG